MHALHLIINHCMYVFIIVTGGDLSAFQQDCGRIMNHRVDSRTRRENDFQTLPAGRATSIAFWKKRESPDRIPS